jgi:hypothetical protein
MLLQVLRTAPCKVSLLAHFRRGRSVCIFLRFTTTIRACRRSCSVNESSLEADEFQPASPFEPCTLPCARTIQGLTWRSRSRGSGSSSARRVRFCRRYPTRHAGALVSRATVWVPAGYWQSLFEICWAHMGNARSCLARCWSFCTRRVVKVHVGQML